MKPDQILHSSITSTECLSLGATKVELGLQNTSDRILATMERGHSVSDAVEANRACRDSGLKVGFRVMPGLPGSDFDSDRKMFRDLFTDERFCPDYLKIYPTLVTRGLLPYTICGKGVITMRWICTMPLN